MLRPACRITVDGGPTRKTIFKYADNLAIDTSWESLGDSATLTLPNKVVDQSGNVRSVFAEDERLVQHGDRIRIELGYYPDLATEFEGYITGIQGDYPIRIQCEDAYYLLRKEPVNERFKEVSLEGLLQGISPIPYFANVTINNLGTIRAKQTTTADIMEQTLRGKYGLVAFVRNGKLEAGVPYPSLDPDGQSRESQARTDFPGGADPFIFKYAFGNNIISDSLKWQRREEVRFKVIATSFQPNGDPVKVEVGDDTGAVRNFFRYNVSKETLKSLAQKFHDRLSFEGWQGSFTTFGLPRVTHGDTVEIIHPLTGREGQYKVKRVVTRFGSGGYKREIHPDRRVS